MICLLRRAGLRLAMLLLAGMVQLLAAALPPPVVDSVSPIGGPVAGTTPITITGSAFQSGATVAIGINQATSVVWVSATTITCTAPAGSAGAAAVVVTNPDTQPSNSSVPFTYAPAPAVAGVLPTSGPQAGGTAITVSGSGFQAGATVTVGGVATTAVAVNVGAQTISCITGAGTVPGFALVVVTNPDTQPSNASVAFMYVPAPVVASVAPIGGPLAGGTAITISGSAFQSGATVAIGGNPAGSVVWVSATTITCTAPAAPGGVAGAAAVVVTNPDAQVSNATIFYTYAPAPAVTTVTPIGGPLAGGTAITVSGSGFQSGATVAIGGNPAGSVAWVSAATITCTAPAAPGGVAGAAAVVVTNPDTQPSNAGTYAYEPAPLITAVTPGLGPVAGGTAITISGSDFLSGATVTIGGFPAGSVAVTATSISCTTPAGSAGPAALVVTNPDTQSASSSFTFQGSGPAINLIDPALAPAAGGTALTITGSGFVGSSVTIGGVGATAVVVVSPTEITCVSPAGTPGPANVVVTNSDLTSAQTGTLSDAFIYQGPLPTITQVAPVWGPAGTAITINGTNFAPGAQVMIDRVAAGSVVVADAQTVTCTIPAGLNGFVTVTVTNPDFTSAILVDGFNVIGPSDLSAHKCGGSHGISVLLLAPFIAWRLLLCARRRRPGGGDLGAGPRPPPPA